MREKQQPAARGGAGPLTFVLTGIREHPHISSPSLLLNFEWYAGMDLQHKYSKPYEERVRDRSRRRSNPDQDPSTQSFLVLGWEGGGGSNERAED
jgi:hypothetical protein